MATWNAVHESNKRGVKWLYFQFGSGILQVQRLANLARYIPSNTSLARSMIHTECVSCMAATVTSMITTAAWNSGDQVEVLI